MKISTHIGLKEHHGIDNLYDGHFEPVKTGTVEEIITHLESFLYLDSPEFESLRWEGPNGWFYQGAAAGEMLRAEIASLRDGTHPQLTPDHIEALNYHDTIATFAVGQTINHVGDDGKITQGTIKALFLPFSLDIDFVDGEEGTADCDTCF